VKLDKAVRHNSDNNCGNWSKKGKATEIVLSVASGTMCAAINKRPSAWKRNIEETRIMPSDEAEDTTVYTVVINHEEQYSIWPKHKAIPQGWKAVGKEGLKPECLQYVDEVWTDMRPLSLRKRMEAKS